LVLKASFVAHLLHKEMSVAVVFVLLISVNMLFTGVMAFNMTKNPAYLYADLGRGGAILLLLCMYRFLYLQRATPIAAK
jgi:predicted tellurium resistance membrane protein TerC